MPPGFHAPGRTIQERSVDVWAATSFYGAPLVDFPPRSGRNLPTTIARVKPGLTIAAAQRRLDALVASLQQQFPGDYPASSAWTIRLVPLKEAIVGDVRQPLMLLFAAVGVVLLIGCVNVANLMLARASARGREIALRQALGAAHQRLVRQLLTESVLLSLVGGVAGLAGLLVRKGFLVRFVPENLPRLNDISISWGVLLFAMAATLSAGAIFGLAPVLHLRRVDLVSMLKRARGGSATGETLKARRVLVVTEFALSLVLLVATGLLLRSFWDLLHVPLGFSPQNVMAIRTRFPYPNDPTVDKYKTDTQRAPFFRAILRRSRTLPGVHEAAFGNTSAIPLDHAQKELDLVPLIIEGRDSQTGDAPQVHGALVSPEYFHLMGMSLVRGRLFADFDNEDAPGVTVINAAMAWTFWPDQDPLGSHVKLLRSASTWVTVVGVVADARVESLTDAGVPEIYGNIYQRSTPHAPKHLALFLRGYLDAASLPDAVRDQIQAVDPSLPVFGAQALDKIVSATLSQRRFAIKMVGLFALTALLLAAVGTYGVISYIVSERAHEIGIRLALGAQGGLIVRTVLLQGLGLTVAGTAVGLVCAAVASRAMAGVLYGVRPTDPPTLAAVAVLLTAVGLFACYVPARRAVRVDPMIVLRCE
jgi:predicted permease